MRQCEVFVRNYLLCFYYVCESKFETKHKRTLSHPDRGEAQEQNIDDLKCTENVNVIGSFEEKPSSQRSIETQRTRHNNGLCSCTQE